MHEAGIAERILEVALARAAAAGGGRIRTLDLELGDDAGVDAGSVAFHWPLVSSGTAAEGAILRIEPIACSAVLRLVAIDADPAR